MPQAYFLNAPTRKVAKRAGRNQWFLHFLARYALYRIVTACRTFAGILSFPFRHRIVSAPAPLPLTGTEKRFLRLSHGAMPSSPRRTTIHSPPLMRMSGSGAGRTDDTSYATITTISRKRVVKGYKFAMQDSVRGSLNRRFKLSFWVLLGQRPKVPRAGARNAPRKEHL